MSPPDARFFISYSRSESDLMIAHVRRVLESENLAFWYDEHLADTSKSDRWWPEISTQIDTSHAFIFLFTAAWVKSKVCQREYATALELGREMIPVQIDDFDVQASFAHIRQQYSVSMLFHKGGRDAFPRRLNTSANGVGRRVNREVTSSQKTDQGVLEDFKAELASEAATLRILGGAADTPLRSIFLEGRLYPIGERTEPISVAEFPQTTPGRKLLILGIPGSGKSTLLQYVQLDLAESKRPVIPIRQSARILAQRDRSVTDWLRDYIAGKTDGQLQLSGGGQPVPGTELVLMIDAIDEVSEGQFDKLIDGLAQFSDLYPDAGIILTSRYSSINLASFSTYEILQVAALTDQSIRQYVEAVVPAEFIEQVWATIVGSPQLTELCRTPFILAMICAAHGELGGKATERATIYRRCVGYLLKEADWQSGRPGTGAQEVELLRRALRYLALRFFKLDSSGSFRESELIETIRLVPGFENDAPRLLKVIVDRTGLLQADRDRYEFVHRTIWEYLVAEGCRDEPVESLAERANARHWEEPLRLYGGLLGEAEFERYVRLLWPRNPGLALRVMTELVEIPMDLLSDLYSNCDRDQRVRILQELRTQCSIIDDPRHRAKLLCDTISVILKLEKSAEFVFQFYTLLHDEGSAEALRLARRIIDDPGIDDRRKAYLSEPGYSLRFARIPGGTFIMGMDNSPEGWPTDASEKPQHEVHISEFEMSDKLITNGLFYDKFPYCEDHRNEYSNAHTQPVNMVTWYEAKLFALWLGCDLPTDAEWEYAARSAGKDDVVLFDGSKIPSYAWFDRNSNNMTHPVGEKLPNSFGLYDVSGNLREWCEDSFDLTFYQECLTGGVVTDPVCRKSTDRKVLRGGTFDWSLTHIRPTYRNFNQASSRNHVTGFRIARRVASEASVEEQDHD